MITYGYFNSVSGDRKYNADQMSEYFDGLITNGVYESVGGALQVVANSGMTVKVLSGRAIINCKWLKNDSAYTVTINAANGLYPRYTAVIVRLDRANRYIEITTKDGTAAASPAYPTIAADELALAMVLVPAGATSITQANITDTRPDTSICGWITGLIEQVDTEHLWDQWQDAYQSYYDAMTAGFDEWMSSLTEQLNVNTYIQKYKSATIATTGYSQAIVLANVLSPAGYAYESGDVILFYINGLLGVEGTDYTFANGTITPSVTALGNSFDIVVLKSKIGFSV